MSSGPAAAESIHRGKINQLTNAPEDTVRSWNSPWKHPSLSTNDVHVWRANLDQPKSVADSLLRILAPDEFNRAEKYYFPRHRDLFVIARGVLRKLLGRYSEVEPDRLRFLYGPQGKPALVQSGSNQLCFNVSHSQRMALYAITLNREVGIDVEHIREDLAGAEIAERFFAKGECATLRALPTELRTEAFFNCWTRKEAYIKARGGGLSLPLDQFEVSLAPGEAAAILRIEEQSERTRRWTLKELAPAPGYVGAVAVAGTDWQLSCWDWNDYQA